MALQHDDLALLSARWGVARFGASRFGFIPCPEDVEGAGTDEPGEYIWREVQPPTTEWEIINEDCVCRDLCTLALGGIIIIPNDQTNRWALDETSGARVDSGAALNLTDNNTVLSADGVISNAALFNKENDEYLSRVANGTELYPQGEFTFSCWIYPTAIQTTYPIPEPHAIICKDSLSGTDRPYEAFWYPSFNIVTVRVFGSDGLDSAPSSAATVLPNRWNHVAFGYDPADNIARIWVNGAEAVLGSATTADPVTTGTSPFLIGASNGSGVPASFFDGRIDDVRFYDYLWTETAEFETDVDVTIYAALSGVLGTVSGHAQINWGDGRHDQQDFSLLEDGILSFTGHYHVAGNYTITVTVTDERGCVATTTRDVRVCDLAVAIEASDETPAVDSPVGFSAIITGGTAPYQYQWQFEADALWDGLAAYWNLSSVAAQKGQYLLTNTGGVTFVAGQQGDAASFDEALDQILERAAGGQVEIDGADGILLVAWIKVRTGAPVGATFFMNGIFFTSYMHLSTANSTPLNMAFSVTNDAGEGSVVGSTTPAYDTWYFWAIKYDPTTRKVSISRDGGAWTEATATTIAAGAHPTIGTDYGAGIVHIGGENFHPFYSRADIDEVGLFNAVKSDADVAALYAAGAGTTYPGSTEETPSWTYETEGTKTITLTVTDANGCTASATMDVEVTTQDCLGLAIDSSYAENFGVSGDFDSTTTGGTGPFTYEWRFWSDEVGSDSSLGNPIWTKTDEDASLSNAELTDVVIFAEHGPWCSGQYRVTVTDTATACTAFHDGTWTYNCV